MMNKEQLKKDKALLISWAKYVEDWPGEDAYECEEVRQAQQRVTQAEERRKYITEILTDQHKSELEGKGYDFYFKLRTDLDQLNQDNE